MYGTARQAGNLSQQTRGTTSIRAMFAWTVKTIIFMSRHRVLQEAFSIRPGYSTMTFEHNDLWLVYKFWTMVYRPSAPSNLPFIEA